MGHDGEGDPTIDVVEPTGSDTFAVNKFDGKQVGLALAPAFPSTRRATDLQSRKAIYFDLQSQPYCLGEHQARRCDVLDWVFAEPIARPKTGSPVRYTLTLRAVAALPPPAARRVASALAEKSA
uniref:Uncharacterized protein n=1 Tax=Rhizobium laguerreae TaxID=1076926 RepID=A0A6N9ZKS7_9HYPH|nr:hypothetical protein [Rhizobium laguerreae]